MHASYESPWHSLAKHHLLEACFLLMAPFRSMLLTLRGGSESLAPTAHGIPVYPMVFSTFLCRAFTAHEKQDVVRDQPTQCPDLGGEEVGGHQHVHVRADECFPRGGGLALGCRRKTMALENVAHRLVTHSVSQVRQGPHDPVVAPGAILPRHAHHQGLQLLVDRGAARSLALLGSIKLLRHALAMPAENRVGLDNGGDFFQSPLAQLLTDV